MSKKKNQNEDSIKNFKKAISNFLSLLSEKKIPFLISVTSNILSTFLVVAIPWVSALAIDDIVSIIICNGLITLLFLLCSYRSEKKYRIFSEINGKYIN